MKLFTCAYIILILALVACKKEGGKPAFVFPLPLGFWSPAPNANLTGAKMAPAVVAANGKLIHLYPVTDSSRNHQFIGFNYDGHTVIAIDENQNSLWQKTVGPGDIFGFGDFDVDGVPDVGFVKKSAISQTCLGLPMSATWLDFLSGKSGAYVSQINSPTDDLCWSFGGVPSVTHQSTGLSILRSTSDGPVALVNYYAQGGSILSAPGGQFRLEKPWIYPSVPAFDSAYSGIALPNPYGNGSSYIANSHPANGLLIGNRLVMFTSARVSQYDFGEATAKLVADHPFLPDGRTDLAGRNYGTVSLDPLTGDDLWLVAGTSAISLYCDTISGTMTYDPWGGIERHIAHYQISTNFLEDQFISNAHDDNANGGQFEWRITYPANALLQVAGESASRLVWNTYQGGQWTSRITKPKSLEMSLQIPHLYIWDVRDLDGDGTPEIIGSSTDGYYADWNTHIYRWDKGSLVSVRSFQGAIPFLRPRFHHETANSMDDDGIFPVATEAQSGRIVLFTPGAQVRLADIQNGSIADQNLTAPNTMTTCY